jgi:ATP-binding protein involved in chromosome partitioning
MNVPLLAEIPLDPATRLGGDSGKPIATLGPSNSQAQLFETLARKIVTLAAEASQQKLRPKITIAD